MITHQYLRDHLCPHSYSGIVSYECSPWTWVNPRWVQGAVLLMLGFWGWMSLKNNYGISVTPLSFLNFIIDDTVTEPVKSIWGKNEF